jgi:hypothetical protein
MDIEDMLDFEIEGQDKVKDSKDVEEKIPTTKMTKEELVANGLLPASPPKAVSLPKKDKTAETPVKEPQIEEIPMEQMERQVPKHAATIDSEDIARKASARGGMALELIKAILSSTSKRPSFNDVDNLVKYAFELADGIQAETDRGYSQTLVNAAARQVAKLQ